MMVRKKWNWNRNKKPSMTWKLGKKEKGENLSISQK